MFRISDLIRTGQIKLVHTPSAEMISDILTKATSGTTLIHLRSKILIEVDKVPNASSPTPTDGNSALFSVSLCLGETDSEAGWILVGRDGKPKGLKGVLDITRHRNINYSSHVFTTGGKDRDLRLPAIQDRDSRLNGAHDYDCGLHDVRDHDCSLHDSI
jgi:hypothetical protein